MLQLEPFSLHPWQSLPAQPWTLPCNLESRSDNVMVSNSTAFTSDIYKEQERDLPLRTQLNEVRCF